MDDAERAKLVEELKRAFRSATASSAADSAEAHAVGSTSKRDSPIAFTQPLLRAVLAGGKTQTRRPIRPQPASVVDGVPLTADDTPIAPPCVAGGRMWVREKWARVVDDSVEQFVYAIDGPNPNVRWNSSRFMPRAAARTFLQIERVEVAHLNAIDDGDATREGSSAEGSSMFGPRSWFLATWDSIYGDGEFASSNNPWVWVITFSI